MTDEKTELLKLINLKLSNPVDSQSEKEFIKTLQDRYKTLCDWEEKERQHWENCDYLGDYFEISPDTIPNIIDPSKCYRKK